MKIKVANYIADFLANKGVTDIFTITGGGAMHLNDAFGHHGKLRCIYNHHEQACAIAAEGYARLTGKIAAVCVTSGPGGTNAITGVLGGWQDSIPMFVVSGQVKRVTTTWSTQVPLRQLGDQEFQIAECVKIMTKYSVMVTKPEEIRYHLEKAWYIANHGRKGPVWIDVPLDVQAAMVEEEELYPFDSLTYEKEKIPVYDEELTGKVLEKLLSAQRPVIYVGTGVRLANAQKLLTDVIQKLKIPVVTAWNAHDLLEDEFPYYCGRPGTVGTRGGNFVVQNADVLLVIGCRMNIRLIGYNYETYAKNAYKIMVDIDENELNKPTFCPNLKIHADLVNVLNSINNHVKDWESSEEHLRWLKWCKDINGKYPAVLEKYKQKNTPVNPYVFIEALFEQLKNDDVIVCGNGSACVVTFQAAKIKKGQRVFTNSGCAAMGYGFPAAIGCALAEEDHRIICIDGDGSFQMNMQELQTVVHNKLKLKLFLLNNNGYHSIRQTQKNLFSGNLVGVSEDNGISFPNMEKIAEAYGIEYRAIREMDTMERIIKDVLDSETAVICEIFLDVEQGFEPKLSSKILEDGTIVSPEIDDMYPFLDREEYLQTKWSK